VRLTDNIFAGQPEPIKTLNDNALQHSLSVDDATMLTSRFVLCVTKKNGLAGAGPLMIFHNLEGPEQSRIGA